MEQFNKLRFCMSHKYFKDAKAMQINKILKEVKFDMEDRAQPAPKTIGT